MPDSARSHAQSQLLAAGEPSSPSLSGHTVLDMKGARYRPSDFDPYFAQVTAHAGAPCAPPHAAALFYDWALSEGQSIITSFGRYSAEKGSSKGFRLVERTFLVDVGFIGPIMIRPAEFVDLPRPVTAIQPV
jgi:hypothetical protein